MLQFVEHRIQHEELGAARDDIAEPLDALVERAPDRDLRRQVRLAGECPEPFGEP
jgi:hypothetical protein